MTARRLLKTAGNGSTGWIATLDTATVADEGRAIGLDSFGNAYIVGTFNAGATILLAKYDANGAIQWQRSLDTSGIVDTGYSIAVGSTGNVYIVGQGNTTTSAFILLAKYDSSGNYQWQRQLDEASLEDTGKGITLDSFENVYITGRVANTTTTVSKILIAKYLADGTYQWQRVLDTTDKPDIGMGIVASSSGNIYTTGQANTGTASYIFLTKHDTDGNLIWQRKLSYTADGIGNAIALDSSENIYLTGNCATTTTSFTFITKYNSLGTIQWQRKLDLISLFDAGYGISVDNFGNSYIVGKADTYTFIAKYSTDGVIAWQRKFAGTTITCYGIAVSNSGDYYITGTAGTTNTLVVTAKFPTSGVTLGTGSYALSGFTFTYTTSTLTESAASLTDATGILSLLESNPNNWIHTISASPGILNYGIAKDSAGNIYAIGRYNTTLSSSFILSKISASGVAQWHYYLDTVASQADWGYGIALDSVNNIYIVGQGYNSTYAGPCIIVAKISNIPSINWVSYLKTTTASTSDAGYRIIVDSTYAYIVGQSAGTDAQIASIALSNGTIYWQKRLGTTGTDVAYDIAFDSTKSYIYVTGSTNTAAASGSSIFVAKYTLAGILQWQKTYSIATGAISIGYAIKLDSSNAIIVAGVIDSTACLLKISSEGTSVSWSKGLSSSNYNFKDLAIDSFNNIYVVGSNNIITSSSSTAILYKYDTNGTLLAKLAARVSTTASADVGNSIIWDSSGYIFLSGSFNAMAGTTYGGSGSTGKIFKIPDSIPTSYYNATASYNPSLPDLITFDISTWRVSLGVAGRNDFGTGVTVAPSGSIYMTGFNDTTATSYAFIAKYDTGGNLIWQRYLDTSSTYDAGFSITTDSLGNPYIVGKANYSTLTASYAFIAKYNTLGAIQWQRKLDSTSSEDAAFGIAKDSLDNLYMVGCTGGSVQSSTSGGYAFIAKYDSSGAIQWQQRLTSQNTVFYAVTVDSSDNIYVTGAAGTSATGTMYVIVIKYNSSGVIQWQKTLDVSSYQDAGRGITCDSSDNIFITGYYSAGSKNTFIIKYSSSGTLLWANLIGLSSTNIYYYPKGITTDSSGNIYVAGTSYDSTAAYYIGFVAKYDTDGNQIFFNRVSLQTNYNDFIHSIAITPSGYLCFAGTLDTYSSTAYSDACLFKVPVDGSTFAGQSIYTATSNTPSIASFIEATGTFTSSASTIPESASTLPEGAATMTSTNYNYGIQVAAGAMTNTSTSLAGGTTGTYTFAAFTTASVPLNTPTTLGVIPSTSSLVIGTPTLTTAVKTL